jgi:hypothetical protein
MHDNLSIYFRMQSIISYYFLPIGGIPVSTIYVISMFLVTEQYAEINM